MTFIRVAVLVATSVMLAGCNVASQSALPSTVTPDAKGLKQRDLLYVANANGTVSVYSYWQRKLVQILTNFRRPLAECADATGNVYITDSRRKKIYEYAHGGKQPIKVLDDPGYTPLACSVAPRSGNLAVANYVLYKSGNIAIYPHGSGKPILLDGSGFDSSDFAGCAYDDRGDLLAMSAYIYSAFTYYTFYYLPKRAKKLIPVTLPGLSGSSQSDAVVVQGVAWDGKYWVAGPIYNYLYLYTINVKVYKVGTIVLSPGNGVYAGPIALYRKTPTSRATQLVSGVSQSTVDYFKYPAGGSPIGQITKGLDAPFGVAVSLRTL